jgi:hypothetical protein
MCADPAADPVTRPEGGFAATDVLLDVHEATLVKSCVEPSE